VLEPHLKAGKKYDLTYTQLALASGFMPLNRIFGFWPSQAKHELRTIAQAASQNLPLYISEPCHLAFYPTCQTDDFHLRKLRCKTLTNSKKSKQQQDPTLNRNGAVHSSKAALKRQFRRGTATGKRTTLNMS